MIEPFPGFEPRRAAEFRAQLMRRAQLLLPEWRPGEAEKDVGRALIAIAAQFDDEIARRLDRMPERSFRAFLDWLGIPPEPARAAVLPLVLVPTEAAVEPVLAPRQVKVTRGGEPPLVLQTTEEVLMQPARPVVLAAVDAEADAITLPPPRLLDQAPPGPRPPEYRSVTTVEPPARRLQIDPAMGIEPGDLLRIGAGEHRVTAVEANIVTIEPALDRPVEAGQRIRHVASFAAFAGRNRQEHLLYLGHQSVLRIGGEARIALHGLDAAWTGGRWQFWGTEAPQAGATPASAPEPGWVTRDAAAAAENGAGLAIALRRGDEVLAREVEGRPGFWLRCVMPPDAPSAAAPVAIAVRSEVAEAGGPDAENPPPARAIEAFHNATPLVLDAGDLHPFGLEPRLFDQFYVTHPEAFAKPGASVTITVQTANATLEGPLLRAGGTAELPRAVGVSTDGDLQRVEIGRGGNALSWRPVAAPLSEQIADSPLRDRRQPLRAAAAVGNRVLARDRDGWLWTLDLDGGEAAGWTWLGRPGQVPRMAGPRLLSATPAGDAQGPGDIALLATGTLPAAFAIEDGRLHRRNLDGTGWEEVMTGPLAGALAALMPVPAAAGAPGSAAAQGLVLLASDGRLAWWTEASLTADPAWPRVRTQPRPLALPTADGVPRLAAIAQDGTRALLLKLKLKLELAPDCVPAQVALGKWQPEPEGAFGHRPLRGADEILLLASRPGAGPRLIGLLASGNALVLLEDIYPAPPDRNGFRHAPLVLTGTAARRARTDDGDLLVAPGANRNLLLLRHPMPRAFEAVAADFGLALRLEAVPAGTTHLELLPAAPGARLHAVELLDLGDGGGVLCRPADGPFGEPLEAGEACRLLRGTGLALVGSWDGSALRLAVPGVAQPGDLVRIAGAAFHRVTAFANGVATLDPAPPPGNGNVNYEHLVLLAEQAIVAIVPTLRRPKDFPAGNAVIGARLALPGARPAVQAISHAWGDALVLSAAWETPPAGGGTQLVFLVRTATGALSAWQSRRRGDMANPTLSWEYFDGRGWWRLPGLVDGTDALAGNGTIAFDVPPDLKPTEVAGRERPWIRARLVGGAYQTERYELVTERRDGKQIQTVRRLTEGLLPPRILAITVAYEMRDGVPPEHLLAVNNLTLVDWTGANATRGARLGVFKPAAALLEPAPRRADPPPRALLLGLDRSIQGGPTRLLTVLEREGRPVRLAVDGLFEDGWAPVTRQDATRGLSESGLLTLLLDRALAPRALLGRTACWLRFWPEEATGGDWAPDLAGLYLNAATAEASEVQAAEILGSASGEPGQVVQLTRKPVLPDSLELRMQEPVDDEETAQLRAVSGPEAVVEAAGLPGRWVRWTALLGPLGDGPGARQYRLDPNSGTITFGDGRNACMPPVGRDNIRAFAYRIGGGAAGNIPAWSELASSTPLPGVDRVLNPLPAGGGADAASPVAATRLGPARIRTRDRAVTPADLERLAFAFSPDIVQARVTGQGGRLRLAVVLRGRQPVPSPAQRRALAEHLAARMSPALLGPEGPEVTGPGGPIAIALRLRLRVATLDVAGSVEVAAKQRLVGLLDPATGGLDGAGWPLGRLPGQAEVAAALAGLPDLLAIERVELAGASAQAGPPVLRPADLPSLAPEAIEVRVAAEAETS